MTPRSISFGTVLLVLTGCRVGPDYVRPAALPVVPAAFKEHPPPDFENAGTEGWKESQPGDAFAKGRWWEIYGDPMLNDLEERVNISNQNIVQAEAQYREAQAQIATARSALFPTVAVGIGVTQSGRGNNAAGTSNGTSAGAPAGVRTSYNLPFNVSWEPDLWGSVRRSVTASKELAEAQEAVVQNAKLLYQAQLAQNYFDMRGIDTQIDLLTRTDESYQEYLTLTRNRYNVGVASDLDVAQAESQLYRVEAQLTDVGVQRAQLEHAIAILVGEPPAQLEMPSQILTTLPPPIPVGVPSELLERRPDVATAERDVAAANEQIGIAVAAYYPSLTLSASAGVQTSNISKWFSWPSRFWSVGPQLSETVFDAGRRRSIVKFSEAAYDATVAQYRQTALNAMQQVEDDLAALRILEQEADQVADTVVASQRALAVSDAQYRAGTTSYLTVITAQGTLLSAQVTQVALQAQRLEASVQLVRALGGGWENR
jgi:NodT family efflux transporter outer membrane factor (OMF) lipoprotein